jgi:hypothetical protein
MSKAFFESDQSHNSIVDLIQESRDFIGHFLKVMTRDVKGPVGIIFDIILLGSAYKKGKNIV